MEFWGRSIAAMTQAVGLSTFASYTQPRLVFRPDLRMSG